MAPLTIRRRKLYHEVLDRLVAGFRSGIYPAGSLLPSERALMETFAVGRPAVREALHSLQRMGLVSIRHGEGARVQALTVEGVIAPLSEAAHFLISSTPQVLNHLKQARLAFEVAMVREAAALATDADIKNLRQALEAHIAADSEDFHRGDVAFHVAIVAVSRNPIYVGLSKVMFDLLEPFYPRRIPANSDQRKTLAEHTRIFERIAARDAEGAAKAIRAHLERAQKLYLQRAERRRPL